MAAHFQPRYDRDAGSGADKIRGAADLGRTLPSASPSTLHLDPTARTGLDRIEVAYDDEHLAERGDHQASGSRGAF
jgi:hypothetical protein